MKAEKTGLEEIGINMETIIIQGTRKERLRNNEVRGLINQKYAEALYEMQL